MNLALWILQGLLALAFAAGGTMKLVSPREKLIANKMTWAADFSDGQVKLIGLSELLGGIGLVAPWATRIVPVLTPIAAACLVVIMTGAAVVHIRRKEPAIPAIVLGVLVALVAIGRSGILA